MHANQYIKQPYILNQNLIRTMEAISDLVLVTLNYMLFVSPDFFIPCTYTRTLKVCIIIMKCGYRV